MLRSLIRLFVNPFSPLEQQLLVLLANNLDTKVREILQRQIESVNLIQRDQHRKVHMFRIHWGKSKIDPALCFPRNDLGFRLAKVSFDAGDEGLPYVADFWLERGMLFSIEFDRSYKKNQESFEP